MDLYFVLYPEDGAFPVRRVGFVDEVMGTDGVWRPTNDVIDWMIGERNDLDEIGQPSDRWDSAEPPTLERVLFHLTQEYARHLGHLDIVAELAGGPTGE